jgi:hypothetical protein
MSSFFTRCHRLRKWQIVFEDYEPVPVHLIHASCSRMPLRMQHIMDCTAPRLRETLCRISKTGRE